VRRSERSPARFSKALELTVTYRRRNLAIGPGRPAVIRLINRKRDARIISATTMIDRIGSVFDEHLL